MRRFFAMRLLILALWAWAAATVHAQMTPSRVADMVCAAPKAGVNFARGTLDALRAAKHLRKFDFVDPDRVSLIGFSWGGTVGLLASSKMWAEALSPGRCLAAAVALYPKCDPTGVPNGGPYEAVNPDIDRPALGPGGEADIEQPVRECVSRLEPLKASGRPVDWTVYPKATHCWDCESLDGFKAQTPRGEYVDPPHTPGMDFIPLRLPPGAPCR